MLIEKLNNSQVERETAGYVKLFKNKTTGELMYLTKENREVVFPTEDKVLNLITENLPALPTPTYKVYSALISQTGTDDPVVTVLDNTLGNIVWTRASAGNYEGTLTGAFTTAKTACILGNKGWGLSPNFIDPYDVTLDTFGSNNIVYLAANNALGGQDGKLNNTFVEIRVYN